MSRASIWCYLQAHRHISYCVRGSWELSARRWMASGGPAGGAVLPGAVLCRGAADSIQQAKTLGSCDIEDVRVLYYLPVGRAVSQASKNRLLPCHRLIDGRQCERSEPIFMP
jgi:hypothetical protein